jgi:NAD(P)-dependent dehydrogenase (short-subunit alcohol dehydrogenase family)
MLSEKISDEVRVHLRTCEACLTEYHEWKSISHTLGLAARHGDGGGPESPGSLKSLVLRMARTARPPISHGAHPETRRDAQSAIHRLSGKICVVTGAARGIGRAIVEAFVAERATVVATDKDQAAGALMAQAVGCRFLPLDVSSEDDWERLLTQVTGADVVVNNAGVTGFESGTVRHDPEHATLKAWRAVHAINLDGTFLGCRYAIRAMKQTAQGSIINISSRSGLIGIPMAAAYASSKAAIRNHTKTVALYCAQQGWRIRCNSIHPAAILTPMWEQMLGSGQDRDARMAKFVADTPLRRFGRPEEVAALAVMLASDEAPYITGSEFNIDGGLLAGSAVSPE